MSLLHTELRAIRVHPVLRDLTITAAASLANFVAGLVVISIFGRLLGVTLLGEYLLLRRVGAWLQPLAHLGLGVGLPRAVAHSSNKPRERQVEYFVAAILSIACFAAVMGSVLWLARRGLSRLFFGAAEHADLILPLFLFLLGGAAQVAVYGFYRGRLEMTRAGAFQLVVALLPLLFTAILFRTHSVALIISSIGVSVLTVALLFTIPMLSELRRIKVRHLPACASELLQYGLSRVPGDFGTGALLAVGPMIASQYLPVSRVSFLLVATGMLLAVAVSTEPLGLIFLSKFSVMLANGRKAEVQKYLSYLTAAIIDLSIFVTIQIMVFADVLVRVWVGTALLEGITVIRILLLGIPAYMFFTGLRSAIDAGTVRPLNARNVVLALGVLVLLSAASVEIAPLEFLLHAIALSLVIALTLLAYLTSRSLSSVFQVNVFWQKSTMPLLLAMGLGAAGLVCHSVLRQSLLQLALFELVFTAVFLAACLRWRVQWAEQLWNLSFPQHSEASAQNAVQPVQLGGQSQ